MKPILVSGIQPTGRLHLGNYLGALKNFVDLQNSGKYRCYFFIADLHSLTEGFDPRRKQTQILDLAADYLAAGIGKNSIIFQQSKVPAHAELGWIFETLAPLGEMERMTQFKNKSEFQRQNINVGLLTYPALMAADIALYNASVVPVGEDQLQHLELSRTLVRKFNNKFGKTFIEPKPLLTKVPRLMSLDDPTKKMSKSRPAGCLFMEDSPAVIRQKIMRATTDSGKEIEYDSRNKAGISNLLLIYSELSSKSVKTIEEKYKNSGYAEFKKDLAEMVIKTLAPFQKRKKELLKNHSSVLKNLRIGNKKANAVASKKILEVKKKIGLWV
ncbi:MAG TPA: tryptophan--tRNA ligase [Candidatus Paceibacterota bacterium]|nr:tryptophan--tRNA ligase [Candidatus Paceibacterota bacterium]